MSGAWVSRVIALDPRPRSTWKTFPERLQEAGVSWKSYQNELARSGLAGEKDAWLLNFGDNILECFAAYNVEAYSGAVLAGKGWLAELADEAAKLESSIPAEKDAETAKGLRARLDRVRNQIETLNAVIARGGEARYNELTEQEKALHQAAFVTNANDPDYHALDSLPFESEGKQQSMWIPKGDIFHQFRKDVNEGKLPTISWLTAPEKFSDHPTSAWYGAWYVSEVMDILTKNPEVWKKTIFILTYDENDGYFDHAPSFVAADPRRPETGGASAGIDTALEYTYREDELRMGVSEGEARSGPIGMGFRVPMIVASPWTRGGWVNSQLFDHTSTLMFLEGFIQKKFDKTVQEDNISAWRRAIAGNLTSVFRTNDSKEPELGFLNRDQFVVSIEQARYKEIPSNYRKLAATEIADINGNGQRSSFTSHQEPGTRPACALPYELYAEGGITADGTQFELRLTAANTEHANNAAGAPFNIYLRNLNETPGGGFRSATFAVKSGDTLRPQFALSQFVDSNYSVEVHAPNGFYRSFVGSPNSARVQIETGYEKRGSTLTGNLIIHLRNTNPDKVRVTVADNSYQTGTVRKTIRAGDAVSPVLHLQESHGWYDFTVRLDGSDAETRFAGRVETGRAGRSDPAMAAL